MATLAVVALMSLLIMQSVTDCNGDDGHTHHRHHHYHHDHPKPPDDTTTEHRKDQPSEHSSLLKTSVDHHRSDDSSRDDTDDATFTAMPKYVDDDDDDLDRMRTVVAPDDWSMPTASPAMTTGIPDDAEDIWTTDDDDNGDYDSNETDAVNAEYNSRTGEFEIEDEEAEDLDYSESISPDQKPSFRSSYSVEMPKDDGFADEPERRPRKQKSDRIRQVKQKNRPRWHLSRRLNEEDEDAKSKDRKKLRNRSPWHNTDENNDDEQDVDDSKSTLSERAKNRPKWDEYSGSEGTSDEGDSAAKHDDGQGIMDELDAYEGKVPHKEEKTKATKDSSSVKITWQEWKQRQKNRPFGKSSVCLGCDKLQAGITKAKQLRQQVLRDQLLDKLRLVPVFKQRPWPPKLPEEVFPEQYQHDEPGMGDQYYAKPTELLVFGRDLPRRHRLRRAGTGSYQFGVTGKVQGIVASAELWVYKMSDANDIHGQTLVVTELQFSKRKRLREHSLVMRIETHVKEGWVRLDVTRLVQRWVESGVHPSLQMLAIRCKTCHRTNFRAIFGAKSNFRPVLVIHEQSVRGMARQQRSTENCDPNSGCCKFELYLNFRDMGIHEIFYPRTIKADYCYGTCDRPDAAHHNHTVLVQRHRFASETGINATMWERLQPCCVPVVLREASIMYYLNDGLDTQVSTVPNILVDKCGCA